MTTEAINDVLIERARQINAEGWTDAHDDAHEGGALAAAAACYAHRAQWELRERKQSDEPPELDLDEIITELWPFDETWWKPKGARRDLVRAAALIIAEIERLDRAAERTADLPPQVDSRYPNDVANESPPDDDGECAACVAHPTGVCSEHFVESIL